MGKFDIDDILNELGVNPNDPSKPARPKDATPGMKPMDPAEAAALLGNKKKHTVDRAEDAFNGVPAVPSGQESYTQKVRADNDPAVPVQRNAPTSKVGEALSEIYQPEGTGLVKHTGGDLGELLVRRGAISQEKLQTALTIVKQSSGRRLTEVLAEQGCDEAQVQAGLAEMLGLGFERIDLNKGLDGGIDGKMLQRLTVEFCKQSQVIPLRVEGSRAVVGMVKPDDPFMIDEVRRRLGVASIKVVCVTAFDQRGAMEVVGSQAGASNVDVNKILSEVQETDVQVDKRQDQEVDLEKEAAESPVIRYVNYIIQTAVKEGASDIHIEPAEKKLKVRFRIDGELYETMQPPGSMSAAITSRLKIMANLDISERRLPQDGRIRCTVSGRKLDLRMSTLPT
ncbi:MAG: GspE/PulE family protein, partial [Phycisphaerales bacterium]